MCKEPWASVLLFWVNNFDPHSPRCNENFGHDREGMLEKTKAGPKGWMPRTWTRRKKALKKGLPVAETVDLISISRSSVKRYRKHPRATLT